MPKKPIKQVVQESSDSSSENESVARKPSVGNKRKPSSELKKVSAKKQV